MRQETLAILAFALFGLFVVYAWQSTAPPPAVPAVQPEERTPIARSLPAPDPARVHQIEDLGERWPTSPAHPCLSISPIRAMDTSRCDR